MNKIVNYYYKIGRNDELMYLKRERNIYTHSTSTHILTYTYIKFNTTLCKNIPNREVTISCPHKRVKKN